MGSRRLRIGYLVADASGYRRLCGGVWYFRILGGCLCQWITVYMLVCLCGVGCCVWSEEVGTPFSIRCPRSSELRRRVPNRGGSLTGVWYLGWVSNRGGSTRCGLSTGADVRIGSPTEVGIPGRGGRGRVPNRDGISRCGSSIEAGVLVGLPTEVGVRRG